MIEIKRFDSQSNNFESQLKDLLSWETESDQAIFDTVHKILHSVRLKGDQALLEYSEKFDGLTVDTASELELSPERLEKAYQSLSDVERNALDSAAERIRSYAEHQKL